MVLPSALAASTVVLDRHLSLGMLSLITMFCCSNENTRWMSRMHDGGTDSEFEELKSLMAIL
jgi:hypothetical protein